MDCAHIHGFYESDHRYNFCRLSTILPLPLTCITMLEWQKMKKYQTAFLISMLVSAVSGHALATVNHSAPDIKVLGLFKNAAVVNINEHRTVLRVGEKKHGNLRLLAANSEKAIFEVSGKTIELSLSNSEGIRTDLPVNSGHQAHLISNGGMYSVTGSVNGRLADFVVDTGASYITMSPEQARLLNLDYSNAKKVMMNTANGKATAHVFTIKSVRIGSIELHDVEGAVMYDLSSSKILLGMSFLGQVEMQHNAGLMVLKQRNN